MSSFRTQNSPLLFQSGISAARREDLFIGMWAASIIGHIVQATGLMVGMVRLLLLFFCRSAVALFLVPSLLLSYPPTAPPPPSESDEKRLSHFLNRKLYCWVVHAPLGFIRRLGLPVLPLHFRSLFLPRGFNGGVQIPRLRYLRIRFDEQDRNSSVKPRQAAVLNANSVVSIFEALAVQC